MPRSIELSVSPEKADAIVQRIGEVDGVVGFARQRGTSLRPPGDVLSIHITNDTTRQVQEILAELDVADGGSIATSEIRSLISPGHQDLIDRESNETTWDEMAFLLRRDTTLQANYLAAMALAGAIAAVGLWTDTLHLVIGAMVIAPAFEPLAQIPFGFIVGPRQAATSGVTSSAAGYAMIALGGALAVPVLQAVDPGLLELETRSWVSFWSTVTPTGVLASALAAAAGSVVISGQRSVLTTGVMIALALIPSMTIVGMGISTVDFALAARGLIRWAVDAALVVFVGACVVLLKRTYLDRHRSLS